MLDSFAIESIYQNRGQDPALPENPGRFTDSARRCFVILWLLSRQELSTRQVAQRVGISDQSVNRYLRLLQASGVVSAHRAGMITYFKAVNLDLIRDFLAGQEMPDQLDEN